MPTGSLPSSAKALWEKVYNDAKAKGDSEEKAAKKAWGAVRNAGWSKDEEGKWHKKAQLAEFSLSIKRASYDEDTGEMRWRADASDTDNDSYNDNMTLELFSDFVSRIEKNEAAPEEFQTEFWRGGMPYLSISHYPDLDGVGVPGPVESVYIDGTFLKSKGKYNDTPLGRACFRSIRDDLYNKESEIEDKVRISIAFLDYMHKHKSNGYTFEREELSDFCPECLRELIEGEYAGKEFIKGQLIHLAHTRVPVNKRTLMEVDKSMTTRKEDAASIVGEELAEELDEKATVVGKSEALVIKADEEETAPEPEVVVEEGKHDKEMEKDDEDEEEEKKMKEKKAEVVEEDKSEQDVREILERLKAEVFKEPEPVHPLDEAVIALKASYDQAIEADLSVEDKLRFIQESYVAVGEQIKSDIRNQPQPEAGGNDIMQAVRALAQQVELLAARMDEKESKPEVPARRSIQPNQINPMTEHVSMQKSETPKLHDLLAKTV